MANFCSNCSAVLGPKDRRCEKCGTHVHDSRRAKKKDDERISDGRCEWNADGVRCKYPGSISVHSNGRGPWFCRWHWNCGDPYTGAKIAEESQSYEAENEMAFFKTQNDAWLTSHGLARREDEAASDHIRRMRDFIRKTSASFRQRFDRAKQEEI